MTSTRKTFMFMGLGFPIKLTNIPMKKVFGKWCPDLNLNKLMTCVLEALTHKPVALSGDELRFIRSYLKMTLTEFGKVFGVSHVAVLKWETGKNKISPSLDAYIRLYISDHLHAKDSDFRALYKETSLDRISQHSNTKTPPMIFDASTKEIRIAL